MTELSLCRFKDDHCLGIRYTLKQQKFEIKQYNRGQFCLNISGRYRL